MKKVFVIFILLGCFSMLSFSQEKTELGISTEGSWFMPQETEYQGWEVKNGFGTGIGIYASRDLLGSFSADIGLAYRYKQMQQHYSVYTGSNDPITGFPIAAEGWDKLSMHYVVVPVHIKMLLSKNFLIKCGIESTWLTNYEVVNEKPEFNWTIGFGSQKYKLKWSVNYIRGFKEQGFGDKKIKPDGHYNGSINKNNMLQLQVSYPIRQLRF